MITLERPRWNTDDRLPVGDILRHDSPGADHRTFANPYARQDRGVGADGRVVADRHFTGNRSPRHDVNAIAQAAVVIDRGVGVDDAPIAKARLLADARAHEDLSAKANCRGFGDAASDEVAGYVGTIPAQLATNRHDKAAGKRFSQVVRRRDRQKRLKVGSAIDQHRGHPEYCSNNLRLSGCAPNQIAHGLIVTRMLPHA
jgi:hypothetical protein